MKEIVLDKIMVNEIKNGTKRVMRHVIMLNPYYKYPLGQITKGVGTGCFCFGTNESGGSIQSVKPPYEMNEIIRVREMDSISCPNIWIKVKRIRVERLQDITQTDAIREGVVDIDLCETAEYKEAVRIAKENDTVPPIGYTPIERFASYWDSTIPTFNRKNYSWKANPYVFVNEFEVCEKPE